MRQFRFVSSVALVVLTLVACQEPLLVVNENEPDRDRALASPADVEALIAGSYATIHNGTVGSNGGLQPKLQVMGLNSYSTLANFEMGPLGAVPRNPIPNTRGNPGESENFRDYQRMHRAARVAAIGLGQFQPGFTLGSAGLDTRAKAFARMVQGVALGNLALAYDSASIITENDPPGEIVPFSDYATLMTAALGYLDSAIALAQSPSAAAGFPLPSNWINGNPLTAADFVRFVRSYQARFRAGVARTPAERLTVNWAEVIADAENGITADFEIAMNPSAGWDVAWVAQHFTTGAANWHQMWQFVMGMADTSGNYAAWLALVPGNRAPFLVVTPDRRVPQGETRAAQNAASPTPTAPLAWSDTPYLRNRPSGEDQPGDPIGISMYDFYRSRAFFNAARVGDYPVITKAEMDLLAAEGYLRLPTPNFAAAAALIDVSRMGKGQLPSVAGISDLTTPVPGGNACVPRVPAPPNYQSTICGNILEALKWEYRMETAFAGYGLWYFAGRGWGDLPEGTAYNWAVPFQEMDARRQAFYQLGGVGGPSSAAQGTYGLFTGGVY